MSVRLQRFRERLRQHELPGALLLEPINVGYLSGFTGSTAALVITQERARFITDSRYAVQAQQECPDFEVVVLGDSGGYNEKIQEELRTAGTASLAVEADYLTLERFDQVRGNLEGIDLRPVVGLVTALRAIKDAEEIALIRQACGLVDEGFEYLRTILKPGLMERDVAAELEYFLKKRGSEKEGFDTIVASGWRSALPHGRASEKLIEAGDLITFDFSARVGGYYSDITRTVVLGTATDRQREVYHVVLEAQLAALGAIRAGMEGKAVDAVARDLIRDRGFGQYFGHGLGHGLGRVVHDYPARMLSPKSDTVLEPGMVVTVEPGIYIEGWGGVRIEDDVVVTADGCDILTSATKELIEIPI